jgi:hypothetical protein
MTSSRNLSGHHDDASSLLLFSHSFDTLEGTDYLQDIHQAENYAERSVPPSPAPARLNNPTTPGAEITVPALDHTHSESDDCSLVDVSPIKVSRRTAEALPAHTTASPYLMSTPGQYPPYPPRHVVQTNASHLPMTRGAHHAFGPIMGLRRHEHAYHWRQHGYAGTVDERVSNPFFVIRSCHKVFAGYTYLLPCLREHSVVTVNLNRFGHIRRYQEKNEVRYPTNFQ